MFGTLRFILAILVALSHTGFNIFGYNPGVFAVTIFFLISGYVTSALLSQSGVLTIRFYAERFTRLMPSYWGIAALTWVIWFYLPPQSYFLSRQPRAMDWIANVTVVPLNYFMWSGQDRFTLIPPAWSLGLEIQFYLVAPFLLLKSFRPFASYRPDAIIKLTFFLSASLYLGATIPTILDADVFLSLIHI